MSASPIKTRSSTAQAIQPKNDSNLQPPSNPKQLPLPPNPESKQSSSKQNGILLSKRIEERLENHRESYLDDPAYNQVIQSLKRKQMEGLCVLQEKTKLVKMVMDKVGDCPQTSTVKQYNFRVGKFSDMISSLSIFPPNAQSGESQKSDS